MFLSHRSRPELSRGLSGEGGKGRKISWPSFCSNPLISCFCLSLVNPTGVQNATEPTVAVPKVGLAGHRGEEGREGVWRDTLACYRELDVTLGRT